MMWWTPVRKIRDGGCREMVVAGGGQPKPALGQLSPCWMCWMLLRSTRIKLLFMSGLLVITFLAFFPRVFLTTLSGSPTIPDTRSANVTLNSALHDSLYKFASVDVYSEKVENPIIARLLDTEVGSDGVSIGKQQTDRGKLVATIQFGDRWEYRRFGKEKYDRRRWTRPERWEIELRRLKYGPYWPKFLQMLREWSSARKYDPQVMVRLMDVVGKPLRSFGTSDENHKYGTCAVVGNSGILLSKEYGKFIDSHDMVIRINGASTNTFERYVGSKTTLAFVNSNVLRMYSRLRGQCRYPYGGHVPVLAYMCQAAHLMDVAYCQGVQPETPLLVTDPSFDILCGRISKWYSVQDYVLNGGNISWWQSKHGGTLFHYSSGMQAVVLALGLCEEVHLFGFGKVAGVKHHYHSQQKGEHSIHDYEAEYLFYDDLEKNRTGNIAFLNEVTGFNVPLVRIYH